MDPITFLVWTCTIIFAATGVITLLGLTKVIKIESRYLNRLFIVLILILIIVSIYLGLFQELITETGG